MAQLLRPLCRGSLVIGRFISTTSARSVERGVNKVQLLGRVGSVPKDFVSSSGKRLVAFPLATTHSFKSRMPDGTEELTSKTTWHSVNIFRLHLQDFVMSYVQKGSRVYLNGRLQNSKIEQDDGTVKYITSIVADDMIHLQAPRQSEENSNTEEFATKTGELVEFDNFQSEGSSGASEVEEHQM